MDLHGGRVRVGVLGATGTVGQRFITLLEHHPYFVVHTLGASARSAGKSYALATSWKQTTPIPSAVQNLIIKPCLPEHFLDCAVVFSGLDADVAGDIGPYHKFFLFHFLDANTHRNHRGCLSCS
jgi:aspartate-semialdehyde dehydrogenase